MLFSFILLIWSSAFKNFPETSKNLTTTDHVLLNSLCNSGSSLPLFQEWIGRGKSTIRLVFKMYLQYTFTLLYSYFVKSVITTRVKLLTQNLNIPSFKTESPRFIYTVWIPFFFGLGKHSFSSLTVVLLHFIRQKKERRAPEFSRAGPAWKSVCTCKPAYKNLVK